MTLDRLDIMLKIPPGMQIKITHLSIDIAPELLAPVGVLLFIPIESES
jgi:hypothetical protein